MPLCALLFLDLYLLYAKLEEDYGLARHAMRVYGRAAKGVLPEEQFEVVFLSCDHHTSCSM